MKEKQKLNPVDSAQRIIRVYRLAISTILLLSYAVSINSSFIQILSPKLYLITNLIWFVLVVLSSISRLISRQDNLSVNSINILIDLIAVAILAYACGGINSGLFFLMLPEAAMAGMILPLRLSLLSASVASLSTLFVQSMLVFNQSSTAAGFLPSGILGLVLFATTLVFGTLGRSLLASQARAEQSARAANALRAMNDSIIARMETGVLVVEEHRVRLANRAANNLLCGRDGEDLPLVEEDIREIGRLGERYTSWLENSGSGFRAFTHPYSGINIQVQFSKLKTTESDQTLIFLEDTRRLRQRAQQLKLESLGHLSAGLAHEVRNPLSAISQANQLLQQSENLSEEDKTFMDVIDRHCIRMNEIIDVVNQLSRRIDPKIRNIALKPFLEELIGEINESRESPAKINLEVPDNCLIEFDPANLKQVLTNIIENGLRYSELATGSAEVDLSLGSHRDDRGHFLDIKDKGPGIGRDKVQKIFNPFFTTGSGGIGLGLYVARELCEVNFAAVHYLYPESDNDRGLFRVSFRVVEEQPWE
jgi:two-component system, NtrC family, sensor histidine kinase PilS